MEELTSNDGLFAKGKYPLIDSWFFMSNPWPMVILVMGYVWFVFKAGPDFMKHRKPYSLTWLIRLYNVFQVIACTVFVVKIHQEGFSFKNTWKCIDEDFDIENVPINTTKAFSTVWWFLMLRFFEFIETVFFVLKKKQNQISTLHVYHHISTGVLLWIFLKYSAGFMEVFILAINASVHVAMYTYYLASNFTQTTKIVMKLKPFITSLQIVQLISILVHCCVAVWPGCNASRFFYLQIPNITILILLFTQFYRNSFAKKSAA